MTTTTLLNGKTVSEHDKEVEARLARSMKEYDIEEYIKDAKTYLELIEAQWKNYGVVIESDLNELHGTVDCLDTTIKDLHYGFNPNEKVLVDDDWTP